MNQLFACTVLPPAPRVGPLLASASAHVAAVILLCAVSEHMAWFQDDRVDWSAYNLETIQLKVPERIFYRANVPRNETAPRPEARPRGAKVLSSGAVAKAGGFAVPRRLQLPEAAGPSVAGPVILQPNFRIHPRALVSAVPPLAFWATEVPQRPRPRQLILPGRPDKVASPPVLSAPPVLAVPNREPRLAGINLAAAAPVASALLAFTPSSTMPVRLHDTAAEPRGGAIDVAQGEAANLIAVSPDPMPANRTVTVPQGLRNLPAAGGNGDLGTGRSPSGTPLKDSGTPAGGNTADSNRTLTAKADTLRGPGNAAKPANAGPGPSSSAHVSQGEGNNRPKEGTQEPQAKEGGSNPSGSNASAGTSAGTSTQSAKLPGPVPAQQGDVKPPTPELTRITYPANGAFDVIVMQSSPSEELPEAAGLLTGNPVYTVYLNTGAEREWLLEYCVPGRTGPPASTYEVSVGDTAPVSPPYPISTVVPTGILRQRRTRHVLLHGVLTASGRFRDMSAADAGSVVARQVLEVLGDWQFRPAMKENKPIDVEVLLAIPPQT